MSFQSWWHDRSFLAKLIALFAALLIGQIGLCFSTPYTVQPTVELISGHADQLGLLIIQAIFCVLTFLTLIVLVIIRTVGLVFNRGSQPQVVPHDSDSDKSA